MSENEDHTLGCPIGPRGPQGFRKVCKVDGEVTSNQLPSEKENPRGLHQRYIISRIDGTPIDSQSIYFVLKLEGGDDPIHTAACRKAILTYADEIKNHLPELAEDIYQRYGGDI